MSDAPPETTLPPALARLRPDARLVTGLAPDRWYAVLVRTPRQVPSPTGATLWLDLDVGGGRHVTVRAGDVEVRALGDELDALAVARLAGRVPMVPEST